MSAIFSLALATHASKNMKKGDLHKFFRIVHESVVESSRLLHTWLIVCAAYHGNYGRMKLPVKANFKKSCFPKYDCIHIENTTAVHREVHIICLLVCHSTFPDKGYVIYSSYQSYCVLL